MPHSVATETVLAVHEQRLNVMDKAIDGLTATVNRAVFLLVGFSFTVAASAVAVVLGT